MHKTLTLVVPSYNMEAYLPRCIDSLGIDTLKGIRLSDGETLGDRLEVLVVNDGSKDKTSEIGHGFESRHPQIVRVIDKPNGHYGSCINRGLAEAKGTFIKILDADDSFATTAFENYLRSLCEIEDREGDREIDLVISDFQRIKIDGLPIEDPVTYSYPKDKSFSVDMIAGCDLPHYLMPALTYRTERLRKLNYHQTEGRLYTDTEWVVLPLCIVRKVRYWPGILYLYSIGREGQSMNENVWRSNLRQCIEVRTNIATFVAHQTEFAGSKNRDVVRTLTLKYLVGVYFRVFQEYGANEMTQLLRPLDDSIKSIDAEMYEALRTVALPRRRGFHLIRFWQDHRWSNGLIGCYLRLYSRIVKFILWLTGKR